MDEKIPHKCGKCGIQLTQNTKVYFEVRKDKEDYWCRNCFEKTKFGRM